MTDAVKSWVAGESWGKEGLCLWCMCALLCVCANLGVKTVHEALHDVELILDGEVDKVGVDEYVVGRSE